MLLIDGTLGSDVSIFLARLHEESLPCDIIMYATWLAHSSCGDHHHEQPKGIIYMRVMPEIALKRLHPSAVTLEQIQEIYKQKTEQFIENKNNPAALQDLPVLVLNGNIDFQTDFSQFYSHLFYIKRFLNQIQEREEVALGIHKEKAYRRCC